MDKIDQLREEIDSIDDTIMELLEKRYTISIQIGNLKKEHNISVLDQNREEIILKKASKHSHYPSIESVYRSIMEESKKLQRK